MDHKRFKYDDTIIIDKIIDGNYNDIETYIKNGLRITGTMLFESINHDHFNLTMLLLNNLPTLDIISTGMIGLSVLNDNKQIFDLLLSYYTGDINDLIVNILKHSSSNYYIETIINMHLSKINTIPEEIFYNCIKNKNVDIIYLLVINNLVNVDLGAIKLAIKSNEIDIFKLLINKIDEKYYDIIIKGICEELTPNKEFIYSILMYIGIIKDDTYTSIILTDDVELVEGTFDNLKNNIVDIFLGITNNIDIIRFLLNNGVYDKKTLDEVLLSRALSGDSEIMNLLIQYGADTEVLNNRDILMDIANNGEYSLIQNIINRKMYGEFNIENESEIISRAWIKGYIKGNYHIKDKYLLHIPVEVDLICKNTKINPKNKLILYRGITNLKNNISNIINKNTVLVKFNTITSWSTNKEISQNFGDIILKQEILLSDIYCDFRIFNKGEEEVILYPGTYKCKINNPQILYKHTSIDYVSENTIGGFKGSEFEKIYQYIKTVGGSNTGGLYKRIKDNKEFYIKLYDNKIQGFCEHLANVFYREVNIDVPRTNIIILDKKYYFTSEYIYGDPLDLYKSLGYARKLLDGFIYDLYLLNWDVIGIDYDNIIVYNNKVYRIDNGGSLLVRAQGEFKTDQDLSTWSNINELSREYQELLYLASFDDICGSNLINKSIHNIENVKYKYGSWLDFIKFHTPFMDQQYQFKLSQLFEYRLYILKHIQYECMMTSK
jgi:hypothetical protein